MKQTVKDLDARLNSIGNLMGERLSTDDARTRPDLIELVGEYDSLMKALEYRLGELVNQYKFYETLD